MADLSGQEPQTAGVNPWLIAISVMLATFMEVLDTSIASVALPYIAGSLSSSNEEATWVLTSYLVANAVILPASNWFSLKFGRKRFLILCIIIFTVASFFCGAATSLGFIIMARIVQGAGGGALQPLSQAILLESFPPKKRGAAMALFGFGVVIAPIIGPTLGGWLTDSYSWRYAFYINIPIGILAIYMISRFVHDPHYIRNAKPGKFDNLGFGLLALWTGCLQVILDKGQEVDWFGAVWVRWAAFFAVAGFIWFVVHSWRRRDGLVNLHTFKDRNFAVGCVLISVFGLTIYSTITLLPLFFQELLGYTAFAAGLIVGPRGFGSIVAMPIIGYLTNRVDARYLLTFGFVVFGITSLMFGNLFLGIGPWTLLWPIVITGFALSFVFVPIATQCYATLKNEEIGNASGIFNLMRNIGGAVGISAAETMVIRRADLHQSQIVGSIPLSGRWFEQNTRSLTHYFAQHMGTAQGGVAAHAHLYHQILDQARLYAYVDIFRDIALVCFVCVSVVWLFKRAKPGRKAPAGAH